MTPFEFATGYIAARTTGKPFGWMYDDLQALCKSHQRMYDIIKRVSITSEVNYLGRILSADIESIIAEMEPKK